MTVVFHYRSGVQNRNVDVEIRNEIKNVEVSSNKLLIYYERIVRTREMVKKDETGDSSQTEKKRTSNFRMR